MFPAAAVVVAVGAGLMLAVKLGKSVRLGALKSSIMNSSDLSWVPLTIDGTDYLVSSTYLAPMGIGEAVQYAKDHDLVLPTPRMVDAIWEAADLKVEPISSGAFGEANKGDNADQFAKHAAAVEAQIGGRSFKLLGGTHKDVVFIDKAWGSAINKPGIYGWHRTNGKVIQDPMWGHALAWKDYSQGLRLIKRA